MKAMFFSPFSGIYSVKCLFIPFICIVVSPCGSEMTPTVICETKPADHLISTSVDASSALSSNGNSLLCTGWLPLLAHGLHMLLRRQECWRAIHNFI